MQNKYKHKFSCISMYQLQALTGYNSLERIQWPKLERLEQQNDIVLDCNPKYKLNNISLFCYKEIMKEMNGEEKNLP